jgi:hypothetical protein
VLAAARTQGMTLIAQALAHSRTVAHFDTGYGVDIRRVDPSAPATALPLTSGVTMSGAGAVPQRCMDGTA